MIVSITVSSPPVFISNDIVTFIYLIWWQIKNVSYEKVTSCWIAIAKQSVVEREMAITSLHLNPSSLLKEENS